MKTNRQLARKEELEAFFEVSISDLRRCMEAAIDNLEALNKKGYLTVFDVIKAATDAASNPRVACLIVIFLHEGAKKPNDS